MYGNANNNRLFLLFRICKPFFCAPTDSNVSVGLFKIVVWKEILDGRMDESSMPEGESWSYLEDTADSIKEATYRLKNMTLLDACVKYCSQKGFL